MHMRGEPASMQVDPQYDDVVEEVKTFLAERVQACVAADIARERLCIDPGFGFGKLLAHNLQLLRALAQFEGLGLPLAVGLSRKSMVAALGGRAQERLAGSLALATIAVLHGARIVRAHDVAPTVDAVRIASAVRQRSSSG
jgi:dihydropteroate synthase